MARSIIDRIAEAVDWGAVLTVALIVFAWLGSLVALVAFTGEAEAALAGAAMGAAVGVVVVLLTRR